MYSQAGAKGKVIKVLAKASAKEGSRPQGASFQSFELPKVVLVNLFLFRLHNYVFKWHQVQRAETRSIVFARISTDFTMASRYELYKGRKRLTVVDCWPYVDAILSRWHV